MTIVFRRCFQRHNSAKLVSKRCDDFREKAQLQTGKVHDPIAETLNVPSDHTFGGLMKPDSFGVGDLLHQTPSDEYLKGKDRQRAVVSAVRQHLKKSNYQNFGSLLEEFKYYDKMITHMENQLYGQIPAP
ncbi:hypothetical protein cypCar_00031100 [Cyprinus carpio]|nr:hypothetical protein cypCar_00031100 [Cyprinus carpio]